MLLPDAVQFSWVPLTCAVCYAFMSPVADPGFPVGGRGPVTGGCGPPMWVLFTENVCENERIGSHRGACAGHAPRSANGHGVSSNVCKYMGI